MQTEQARLEKLRLMGENARLEKIYNIVSREIKKPKKIIVESNIFGEEAITIICDLKEIFELRFDEDPYNELNINIVDLRSRQIFTK